MTLLAKKYNASTLSSNQAFEVWTDIYYITEEEPITVDETSHICGRHVMMSFCLKQLWSVCVYVCVFVPQVWCVDYWPPVVHFDSWLWPEPQTSAGHKSPQFWNSFDLYGFDIPYVHVCVHYLCCLHLLHYLCGNASLSRRRRTRFRVIRVKWALYTETDRPKTSHINIKLLRFSNSFAY